jgi:IS30 family transposase
MDNRDYILSRYKAGWSVRKIASSLRLSHPTVARILRSIGVKVLRRGEALNKEFYAMLDEADKMGVDLYEMSLRGRWRWAKQHGLFSGSLEKFRQLWSEYENSETL